MFCRRDAENREMKRKRAVVGFPSVEPAPFPARVRLHEASARVGIAGVILLASLASAWLTWKARQPSLVYTGSGYGGYVAGRQSSNVNRQTSAVPRQPIQAALDAYNGGRYEQAEAAAGRFVDAAARSEDPARQ